MYTTSQKFGTTGLEADSGKDLKVLSKRSALQSRMTGQVIDLRVNLMSIHVVDYSTVNKNYV